MIAENAALHPYYPIEARIIGYAANEASVQSLLASASAGCVVILGTVLAAISHVRPALSKADRLAILWFFLCMFLPDLLTDGSSIFFNFGWGNAAGTLHCFFEGYFVLNHDRMASAQDIFGQLWKEYALSDSRYLTSDTLILCMETMTTVSSSK